MSCFLDSLVSKVVDVVWDRAIVPVGRQLKYVFCYKSNMANMKAVDHDLECDEKFIQQSVAEADNNLQVISDKAKEWLEKVDEAHKEVRTLLNTYEEYQATKNSCMGQILNPIARHQLGRKATKKKQTIQQLLQKKPNPDEISSAPPPPGILNVASASAAAAAKQQTDEGIFRSSRWEEIKEEIMTALQDNRTNVIGLHGMGGVGKSTMIKVVHDQVKKQRMFDEVAKVEVKVKPEIRRMQEEIAFPLGLKLDNESPAIRADLLRKRLLKTSDKKAVLIILDDVWEKLDLEEVGIPLGGNAQVQIKLLLTSRDEYLLSDKMGAHDPIHLDVLSDADALKMFNYFAGVGAEGVKDDMVTKIARKCSGLPIVIEATAKALKDTALNEWENILNRLDNDDVLEKLKVSYDYLPSKESKDLFLLCGISRVPSIQVRDLLNYSFGLGLYEGREGIHSLADAGRELEKLLSGLEAASMLLKRENSLYVNIHDHMRDLAVRIRDRDRLEWVHFTLRDDNSKLPRKFEAPRLELLLSYCEEGGSLQAPESFFKEMKKLYVLEFTNYRGALPLSPPTDLPHHLRTNLTTLCFHSCSLLGDISMIGELKGLQILSFRGSNIRKLPIQLRGLTALKMLDLSDCKKLTLIEPTVLGSLTKLEELNMENSFTYWDVGGDDDAPSTTNARLSELNNMTRLSNVSICIPQTYMLPKDGQLFSSKLATYRIMFGVYYKKCVKDNYMEYEDIYDKFSDEDRKFSRVLMLAFDSPDILWHEWVQTTLQTAELLFISGCLDEKCESLSKMCIKGFDCLKHLRIRDCSSLRFISSSDDGSCKNLESLFLGNLSRLEKLLGGRLPRHEEAFSKLKVVKVKDCYRLKHLFDFSLLKGRLSSQLEKITVERCSGLQWIVGGEADNNYDVVTLSKLQTLKLKNLRQFLSFCAGPSSNVLFAGKKVAFPCMETLVIGGVGELKDIWHPTDPPAELGNLRLLHVKKCNYLVHAINSSVLMRLEQHLESLRIDRCGLMKEVFDVDGIISSCTDKHLVLFSGLKVLRLSTMEELKGVHNNKNLMTIFPNIEWLYVYNCRHLRYVLCCSMPSAGVGVGVGGGGGGGYENLESIYMYDCYEMEAIVEVMPRMVDQETQQASSIAVEVVLFPRLKQLHLRNIKGLKGIYVMHNLSGGGDDDIVLTMFPNIESLNVSYCHALRYVLSWSSLPPRVGAGFVHLSKIEINDCERMEAIVMLGTADQETQAAADATATATGHDDAHHHQNCDAMSFSYSSLDRMSIYDCPQLRTFCQYLCSAQDCAADLPFFGQKEIFPCLEYLRFRNLSDKLGEIWPHEVPPQTSFNMLKKVEISSCPELSVVFPSTLIACLENLTDVSVEDCDEVIQIIIVEEKKSKRCHALHCENEEAGMEMMFTFPRLTTLILKYLPKLDRFYSSSSASACGFQFPSLETLEIRNCQGVKTLFSQRRPTGLVDGVEHDLDSDMDGALFRSSDMLAIPNLVSIELDDLNLTNIWKGEKPEGLFLELVRLSLLKCSNIRRFPPSFCNVLTELKVHNCDGLEYLLTPVGATSLVHLTHLYIGNCSNIKEILVSVEEEEDAAAASSNYENQGGIIRGDDHICDITFSCLKVLRVWELQRLEKFCSGKNMVLNFPSLEDLVIQCCPKMTTFSSGIATATSTQEFGDLNSFVQKIYTERYS